MSNPKEIKTEDCECEAREAAEFDEVKFIDSKPIPEQQPCYLPGNVVFNCTDPPKMRTVERSPDPWFKGYGGMPQNPMYRTTNNDYGSGVPDVHTFPAVFYGTSNAYTKNAGQCGMYRDHGLNTSLDKSSVPEF